MRKNLIKKGLTCFWTITILLTSSGFTNLATVYANVIETESSDTDVVESESGDIDAMEADSGDADMIEASTDDADVVETESIDADVVDMESGDMAVTDDKQSESSDEAIDESMDDTTNETTSQEDTDATEVPDGDYICTLELEETNPKLRTVDNSVSLPISYSSYEVFWPGHGLMYVANDNKYADSMGTWRLVYCYDQGKTTPSGTLTFSGWSNKRVAYAMYYGTMYWGETCRYAPYSTGDWKLDAMATQAAIWVLSGQYTLDYVVDVIIDCCNGTATRAQRQAVEAATQKIVNDANNDNYYTGWNSDGWFDLSLSGKSTFNITGYKNTWTDNGEGYYVSGGSFKTTFKSYYGYDMRSQITSFEVSVPDGVEVVKADSKTFADFSLYIAEDQYNEWKKTGKEIEVTVTMKIPRLWSAGLYKSSDDNYQRTTLLTYKTKSDTATFTKTITLTIPKAEVPMGNLQIQKTSSRPDITDNNSCYSLEGAEYIVYSDSACETEVGTLITEENGVTDVLSLELGTFFIRESVCPSGFCLDAKTYIVTITEDHVTTPYILNVQDKPAMDPITILLKKVDADTNEGVGQNTATLEGAEFTVRYYDVQNSIVNPETMGYEPVREWVFKTDEDGFCEFHSEYLVSGDELIIADSGEPSLPIGTITIQETKAAEGYLLNEEIYVVSINPNGSESITTYAVPIIPENVFKLNIAKIETGTGTAIPGAVFEHTRPNGEKETLTTDKNGNLSFVGLEWGNHRIKEISVMDGYLVNSNEIKFTVSEDNSVEVLSTSSAEESGITVKTADNDDIEVVVEDELAPYSLQLLKKNNNGEYLAGVEFTLYADENYTNIVEVKETGSDGMIIFDDLSIGQKFYLRETKCAKGYTLPENPVVYEIYAESSPVNGTLDFNINGKKYTISDTNESKNIYLSGSWADWVINLEVINNAGMLLPETGSGMTMLLCLFGATLMTGVLVTNNKKKKHMWRKFL